MGAQEHSLEGRNSLRWECEGHGGLETIDTSSGDIVSLQTWVYPHVQTVTDKIAASNMSSIVWILV